MNQDTILDLFNGVSDEFVADAIENQAAPPKGRTSVKTRLLIAAVIVMTALLAGCGIVYMLNLQDLKLGDQQITESRWDAEKNTMVSEAVSHQVLTFSGVKGSVNYLAAQEWMAFEEQYDPDYAIAREAYRSPIAFPAQYDAYPIYSQAQADKLTEITEKYGLSLAGPRVEARTPKSLFSYLNIDSLLLPNAQARVSNLAAAYYENGKFHADFYLLMDSTETSWPYDTFCLYDYTPKTCFDDHFVYLSETADWREWNYTTAAGEPVLILRSDSRNEAYIFRDLEHATAAVKIYTESFDSVMSDLQLQNMIDQLNFSLDPSPGDPAILAGFGSGIDASAKKQTQNGYSLEVRSVTTDGEIAYITLGVTAPEGISLAGAGIHPGNRGEGLMRSKSEGTDIPSVTANWISEEDGDGLDNTQNLVILAESHTMDGSMFQTNRQWNIYIEGLDISEPNSMLQQDVHHQADGVWQFDISLENGDFREVEFVETPVDMNLLAGMGKRADVQLISLKLRRYSATAVFADGTGDLNDYKSNEKTCAVLKDGTQIPMHHIGGPGNVTGLRFEGEIPLEDVAYVTLIDGTKLSPQN